MSARTGTPFANPSSSRSRRATAASGASAWSTSTSSRGRRAASRRQSSVPIDPPAPVTRTLDPARTRPAHRSRRPARSGRARSRRARRIATDRSVPQLARYRREHGRTALAATRCLCRNHRKAADQCQRGRSAALSAKVEPGPARCSLLAADCGESIDDALAPGRGRAAALGEDGRNAEGPALAGPLGSTSSRPPQADLLTSSRPCRPCRACHRRHRSSRGRRRRSPRW